jgi:transmembrane sensor
MEPDARARRERLKSEAAQWVVRLADSSCTDLDRAGFEAWRGESADHEAIFERELAAWERLDQVRRLRAPGRMADPDLLAPKLDRAPLARPPQRWRALAASLVAALGVGAIVSSGMFAPPAYATGLGERRVVVLSDGSRVELNTNSKIVVRYRRGVREVELVRGEAMFEVAANDRPFIVKTRPARLEAENSIVAVRLEGDGAAVTVKSGVVQAQNEDDSAAPAAALPPGAQAIVEPRGISVHAVSAAEIDRTLVWRNGAIAFSGQTLAQASAEFNRYNAQKIVIEDRATAALRVGGYFQTSDVPGFVRAVTQTFPVKATRAADGTVRLSQSG